MVELVDPIQETEEAFHIQVRDSEPSHCLETKFNFSVAENNHKLHILNAHSQQTQLNSN